MYKKDCRNVISGVVVVNQPPNQQPPNQGARIFLYIIGIAVGLALVLTAFVYLLQLVRVIKAIPENLVWIIILFSIGVGILSGVTMMRRY